MPLHVFGFEDESGEDVCLSKVAHPSCFALQDGAARLYADDLDTVAVCKSVFGCTYLVETIPDDGETDLEAMIFSLSHWRNHELSIPTCTLRAFSLLSRANCSLTLLLDLTLQ